MEMNSPLVSVIVINRNGRDYIGRCLESLRTQSYSNFEIIIVDNGSDDGSPDDIARKYSGVARLIRNSKNAGFAGGNNIGFRHSRGRYCVTLNNDTEVGERWLEELVSVAESDSSIGMCASKIVFLEKPDMIDSVGVNIYPDGMSKQRGHMEPDAGQYNIVEEILLPSACSALYRKEMLEEIGFFDEDFFLYCEDTDLGLRGRFAGWKAVLVPASLAYHYYSGTAGRYSPLKAYYVERNHYWVALKLFPVNYLFLLPFYTLLRIYVQSKSVLFRAGNKKTPVADLDKFGVFIAIVKAYASVMASLPAVFKKRRDVWKRKKVSDSQVCSWFREFSLDVRELKLNRIRW
jgi:GT2 family glycosyltransferase